MIYWKYVDWGQFVLQSWADCADKTLNEFVTDRGKYDLGFGRDFDGSELYQFHVRDCWYGGTDFNLFLNVMKYRIEWGFDYGENELNGLHGLWLHYVPASGFTDFDAFHCLERDDGACDFCPHCGIAERYEIQDHASNTYWCASWFCSMPSVRRNHDSAKYVWYDVFRLLQHYKGGFELCKDWEDLDKYGL